MKQAIIIGASSGIGEALARKLAAEGWRVAVTGRREERLSALASELGGIFRLMDLSEPDMSRQTLESLWREIENVNLVIISAGTGYPNLTCDWEPERETLAVNVSGFAAVAQTAMRLFMEQGHGHLAGISSIARFRGSGEGVAYAASKAFVSVYLDGLRDLARKRSVPVTVTELCPGFVDTAMMKAEKTFWVATLSTRTKN